MLACFDPLRQFSFASVLFRLLLALVCGGAVGYGRSKRNATANIRTYMLVCLGAALSVTISLYEYAMLHTAWADVLTQVGERFDASRMAAQAIAGIGFLGAGTILLTSHMQVKGLTTASGLFATVCMGLAAGAGFYECVITATLLIVFVLNIMVPMDSRLRHRLGTLTLTVELEQMSDLPLVCSAIEAEHGKVYETLIEQESDPVTALLSMRIGRESASHAGMLCTIAELPCVHTVKELGS